MALNQEKCQLLAINSELPIYLIDHPSHPCQCDFRSAKSGPFLPKELRIEPTPHADYLGSVLTYNSSATADTKKRYGQSAHAAKCLHDFFKHPKMTGAFPDCLDHPAVWRRIADVFPITPHQAQQATL